MTLRPPIEDLDDVTFDPYTADDAMFGDIEDPYSILHELRAKASVVEGSFGALSGMSPVALAGYDREYMVLSHSGVDQVLNDAETFSNEPLAKVLANYGPLLTSMDPPEHGRYRKVFQRAFRPVIVERWADAIVDPAIDELLASIRGSGETELMNSVVRPFPFVVIYRLLALPPEDIEVFYRLTMAQIATANAAEASTKLARYFAGLLTERRCTPGDDLISELATIETDARGEPLPEEVMISFLLQLMSAGGETTFRTLSVLLTGLLSNPDQLAAVRADRALVPQAVEEALRWDGPVIRGARATTRDAVVDGVPIPANSLVDAAFGAANRDPAVFDDPDRFNIFRERHRHFGFAFGAHSCLGQQVARVEMSRGLNAMLDQLPDLRLNPDYPPPRVRGAAMRTPRQLHVRFGAAT